MNFTASCRFLRLLQGVWIRWGSNRHHIRSVAQGPRETAGVRGKRCEAAPYRDLVWTPFGSSGFNSLVYQLYPSRYLLDLSASKTRSIWVSNQCEGPHSDSSHTGSGACRLVLPFWCLHAKLEGGEPLNFRHHVRRLSRGISWR